MKIPTTLIELTKNERRAVTYLIGLVILFRIVPTVFQKLSSPSEITEDHFVELFLKEAKGSVKFQAAMERLVQSRSSTSIFDTLPFYFDPNSLAPDSLRMTGLPVRAIQNLLAYREKGGHLSKPDDLMKIYGMDSATFVKVLPYMRIASPQGPSQRTTMVEPRYPKKIVPAKVEIIDLNTATPEVLESVRGLGTVLATRIVKYRKLLGGFHTLDQLLEVYGISPETYGQIQNHFESPRRVLTIHPNTHSFKEILRHPYIDYPTAQIIANHKGPNYTIRDSLLLNHLGPDPFTKLRPYLDHEEN